MHDIMHEGIKYIVKHSELCNKTFLLTHQKVSKQGCKMHDTYIKYIAKY